MRKRRKFICIGIASVAIAISLSWWIAIPPHQINRSGFAQIQPGMTMEEVEAVLGLPAGNYATVESHLHYVGLSQGELLKDTKIGPDDREWFPHERPSSLKFWASDQAVLCVGFSETGHVCGKCPCITICERGLFERIGDWVSFFQPRSAVATSPAVPTITSKQ